jgi:hypothetical protein
MSEIGVHTPEFAFEKNVDGIHRELRVSRRSGAGEGPCLCGSGAAEPEWLGPCR